MKTVAGIGALPLEANKSLESPEAGRCMIGFSPSSLWKGELPCPHLDSGLLFSKTIRGPCLLMYATKCVVICYNYHRNSLQY